MQVEAEESRAQIKRHLKLQERAGGALLFHPPSPQARWESSQGQCKLEREGDNFWKGNTEK